MSHILYHTRVHLQTHSRARYFHPPQTPHTHNWIHTYCIHFKHCIHKQYKPTLSTASTLAHNWSAAAWFSSSFASALVSLFKARVRISTVTHSSFSLLMSISFLWRSALESNSWNDRSKVSKELFVSFVIQEEHTVRKCQRNKCSMTINLTEENLMQNKIIQQIHRIAWY